VCADQVAACQPPIPSGCATATFTLGPILNPQQQSELRQLIETASGWPANQWAFISIDTYPAIADGTLVTAYFCPPVATNGDGNGDPTTGAEKVVEACNQPGGTVLNFAADQGLHVIGNAYVTKPTQPAAVNSVPVVVGAVLGCIAALGIVLAILAYRMKKRKAFQVATEMPEILDL